MKKKFFCLLLTICMIFAFTACASADDSDEIPPPEPTVEESTNTEDTSTEKDSKNTSIESDSTKETENSDETVNVAGFTESQMNELYASIASSVETKYFEPNNITSDDFEWPFFEEVEFGEDDEDYSWSYLEIIYMNYMTFGPDGKLYDTAGIFTPLPNDEHIQLMNAVLDGIIDWSSNYYDNPSTPFLELSRVLQPFGYVIPENVTFDK